MPAECQPNAARMPAEAKSEQKFELTRKELRLPLKIYQRFAQKKRRRKKKKRRRKKKKEEEKKKKRSRKEEDTKKHVCSSNS